MAGAREDLVFGALHPCDGHEVTLTGPTRNSAGYQRLLAEVEATNPTGSIVVVADNLSTHSSYSTRTWLADHPRICQVSSPRGVWLNLQEGWWHLFRREACRAVLRQPRREHPGHPGGDTQLNARAR
jgi:hypothetical protein